MTECVRREGNEVRSRDVGRRIGSAGWDEVSAHPVDMVFADAAYLISGKDCPVGSEPQTPLLGKMPVRVIAVHQSLRGGAMSPTRRGSPISHGRRLP